MKILGIETSSTACSIALAIDDKIYLSHQHAPMKQTQLILPMIDELLKSKNITIKQLDAIAFGCGPGSFTGIRIATSIAQGLGFALNIPLIPISSLAALAQTAYEEHRKNKWLIAVDARMQQVFLAKYQTKSKDVVELIGEEQLTSCSELKKYAEDGWNKLGNGWQSEGGDVVPTAKAILQLAIPKFQQSQWITALEVLPVYLRDEVAAKEKKE